MDLSFNELASRDSDEYFTDLPVLTSIIYRDAPELNHSLSPTKRKSEHSSGMPLKDIRVNFSFATSYFNMPSRAVRTQILFSPSSANLITSLLVSSLPSERWSNLSQCLFGENCRRDCPSWHQQSVPHCHPKSGNSSCRWEVLTYWTWCNELCCLYSD